MKNKQQKNVSLSEKIIGKQILIGLSYYNQEGDLLEQTQKYGPILRYDEKKIVFHDKLSKEEFAIPTDIQALKKANPELVYRLKANKQEVTGIELIGLFSITKF